MRPVAWGSHRDSRAGECHPAGTGSVDTVSLATEDVAPWVESLPSISEASGSGATPIGCVCDVISGGRGRRVSLNYIASPRLVWAT